MIRTSWNSIIRFKIREEIAVRFSAQQFHHFFFNIQRILKNIMANWRLFVLNDFILKSEKKKSEFIQIIIQFYHFFFNTYIQLKYYSKLVDYLLDFVLKKKLLNDSNWNFAICYRCLAMII